MFEAGVLLQAGLTSAPMSPQDEKHVRDVLLFFYPDDPPPTTISDQLGNLAAEMLDAALQGSKAMDLLPRPPGFVPGVGWLVSQAVQITWRSVGKTRIYETVRRTVALKKKSEYHMAKLGV
jgi:hypothetical protein